MTVSVRERLTELLKEALRSGDEVRKETLRLLQAAVRNREIELGHPLSEEEFLEVVVREVKRRREAAEGFRKAGRPEAAAREEAEMAVLQAFLPPPADEEEIRTLALQAIEEVGAKGMRDMGRVMGLLMPRLKGRAEGRKVQEIVRQLLSARSS